MTTSCHPAVVPRAGLPALPARAFPWSRPRVRLNGLYQLVCRSVAVRPLVQAELERLLLGLRERHLDRSAGVAGALLHHKGMFLYCLEGPEQEVVDAYARLMRDPHHHSVEELLYRPVQARAFPRWVAACTGATAQGWLRASTARWERHRRTALEAPRTPAMVLLDHVWKGFQGARRDAAPSRLPR